MGKVKYSNNAYGHITVSLSPGDLALQMDDITLFPALGPDDFAYVSVDMEVLRVDQFDMANNQIILDPNYPIQGVHAVGATVELRMCKELLDALGDAGEY